MRVARSPLTGPPSGGIAAALVASRQAVVGGSVAETEGRDYAAHQ
jgi:hypothetical protein